MTKARASRRPAASSPISRTKALRSELRQAQVARERANRELLALIGRLGTVEEAERSRIARELHDDLQQHSFVHVGLDLSSPGRATLFVVDDGVGIGATGPRSEGAFGIRGMRERVRALGGTLEIGPAPGGGTRLEARVAWPVAA